MMKRILTLLALLPALAHAQYIGPIYKPGGVAITGGAIDNTTIGAATQTTGKFTTLTASSNAGVGGNTTASVGMFVRNTALTGTTQTGVDTNMVSTSAATTKTVGFLGEVGTAAAAYTVPIRVQFWASPPAKGAGSTITNDIGFLATDTSQGATTNVGFDSAISSGTGKWNLYAEGTAANYMAGALALGSANLTVPAGGLGIAKITADGAAPGAGGAKLQLVCGTNAGTAKLVISAGTSATTITITDNIGAGVTGC